MFDFSAYLKTLKANKPDEITEHTLRPELKALLECFAAEKKKQSPQEQPIKVTHEPRRIPDYGAPDFKLTQSEGILGYVENKALGADLVPVLKSEQIAKYKKLSENILLTNYLDWIWIKDGKPATRSSLCSLEELSKHRFTPDTAKLEEVRKLLDSFLSSAPEGIGKPQNLAKALGQRGKLLKDYLLDELRRQKDTDTGGELIGLYDTFKKMVDHELTLEDFTNTFAQMLVYGLFMARLNSETEKIDLFNVEKFIPTSFELIHELVRFLKVLNNPNYSETRWIVEEVLAILNTMDLADILRALSFDKHNKVADPETAKDPYVYFYEDFLAAYDKALKKAKGVYYTPPPVVNFIIRAVNDVLKDTFGIADGLADHTKVTLLDFACGTGTFLLETIRQILDATPESKRELIIKEHILKNLYGFEYMIAPYTVAHLKLTQYLKDRGYELNDNERFKVYLTNTLEHFEAENEKLLPALSTESKNAKGAKDKPILVITGNPPYYYKSKNKGEWIQKLVKDYYFCDGQPLGERNPKGLQDDYVKFIRFAQWKIDQAGEGIVAIITNHSFLDNPTFRGMRQSLMKTFNQMYFLDLHGNANRTETAPDGSKDENVFDIKQGVCISILVKKPGIQNKQEFSEIYGLRKSKYLYLNKSILSILDAKTLSPSKEVYYIFKPFNQDIMNNYMRCVSVKDIFKTNGVGINTAHDEFVVNQSKSILEQRFRDFVSSPCDSKYLHEKFNVAHKKGWDITKGWKSLQLKKLSEFILPIQFRPFDSQYIMYDDVLVWRTVRNIMDNFINKSNIGLCVSRQCKDNFKYAFITDQISDYNYLSSSGSFGKGNVFPLYEFAETEFLGITHFEAKPNIKPEIFQLLNAKYATKTTAEITPEAIMGYIYAVLHSPTYREKYKDFLKTDFPRIPFCEDFSVFEQMSALGWQLINAHLMRSDSPKQKYPGLGAYTTKGSNEITKVFYAENLQRLNINDTQFFDAIPEPVYNFHIGGYQVLNKYLKDRKGRTLTLDEINNVEFIAKILAFTMDTMKEIDKVSQNWI